MLIRVNGSKRKERTGQGHTPCVTTPLSNHGTEGIGRDQRMDQSVKLHELTRNQIRNRKATNHNRYIKNRKQDALTPFPTSTH